MAERLTFTLAGRDELSRVLNGAGSSADRLRLRLAGITGDADNNLRNLQGRVVSTDEALRRLRSQADGTAGGFRGLSDATSRLGRELRGGLISLAPAAIPMVAGLAASATAVAVQLGAAGTAAGVFALALTPQILAIGKALDAQTKYEKAVLDSGATSQQAAEAQVAYRKQLEKLPPATQQAAVGVGLLKTNFQAWSDSLSGDVMGPVNKGLAVANALLPKTSGLVKGASGQFDRLITLVGGAIATPGFDALNAKFTTFANETLTKGVSQLTVFLAKVQGGELSNSGLSQWMDYARDVGPAVWSTLEHVGEALLHILEAGADVGVGLLDVVDALSGIVSAVPPQAIATMLQLAIAIKAVKLAAAGMGAAQLALAGVATQVGAMRTAAAGAPGALRGVGAAIGGLSRTAKIAMAGTGIGLLLIGLDAISSKSEQAPPDVDKLNTSLVKLAQGGKVSGEALKAWGKDLSGLGKSLQLAIDPEGFDQVQQSLTRLIGMDSTPVKNAKEDIDSLDKALANMVSQGNADLAAAALDRIVVNLQKQGFSSDEVRGKLDAYRDALEGQRLEQELAAQSMGLFGEQAQETQAQLDAQKQSADGLRQSIQALNDVNRSALDGMIGFEAAIDASTKAAQENAGVLDMHNGKLTLNTEKQRTAAQSLTDLAAKTDEATAAARDSGASWQTVSGIYERGRQQLIKNAIQMGLNRDQAKRLADQILATPNKTAYLKGDLQDLKRKLADAKERLRKAPSEKKAHIRGEIADLKAKIAEARAALKNIPDEQVNLYIHAVQTGQINGRTSKQMGRAQGGLIHRAMGGPIPGYPGGGPVVGPGTSTSDDVLMWGSNGEYMVKAASVRKYGLAFMDALNAGRLAPSPGRAAASTMSAGSADGQPVIGSLVVQASPNASADDIIGAAMFQARVARRRGVHSGVG